jgi:hypothetical protein
MRVKRTKFGPPVTVTGPRVGAIVTRNGDVTVRVLGSDERPTLPGATVVAENDTLDALRRAAAVVTARILAHARQRITFIVGV